MAKANENLPAAIRRGKQICQYLRAPNDLNGNPRRLFAFYDPTSGRLVALIDEGYGGRPGDRADWERWLELPSVDIAAGEYRAWKAAARAASNYIYTAQ